MSYLDKIIRAKRKEVSSMKEKIPVSFLEKATLYNGNRPSFYDSLMRTEPSVIAEFKRKSPSKGILNKDADIISVVRAYEQAGARAVSVLTDMHFDGRITDLSVAFESVSIPLLRKDFIIDEFQIHEARAAGASAILLIAAVLEKKEIEKFSLLATSLGLDVLLELHHKDEISKIPDEIRIIGINNRDLKTFEVNIDQSVKLAAMLPDDLIKVSESGISSVESIAALYREGFRAFLMGEIFMKGKEPGSAARDFIKGLNTSFKLK